MDEVLNQLNDARRIYLKKGDVAKVEQCDKHIANLKAKMDKETKKKQNEKETEFQNELDLSRVEDKFLQEETVVDDVSGLRKRKAELEAELEKINRELAALGSTDYMNDPALLGGRVVDGKFVEDSSDDEEYDNVRTLMQRREAAIKSGHYNAGSDFVRVTKPEHKSNF